MNKGPSYEEILRTQYEVFKESYTAMRIQETAGGWSADAYRVAVDDREFFLKVYDTDRRSIEPWIRRMDTWIPVMVWLQNHTALGPHIPPLHPAQDGGYKVEWNKKILLLFSYIEGTVPGENPLTPNQTAELAGLLAALHKYTPDFIPFSPEDLQEDLSLTFCHELKAILKNTFRLPKKMQDIFSPISHSLLESVDLLLYLLESARIPCSKTALCHTDAHNWNLMQGQRLYLLDWEGVCLAPAEADLFLFSQNKDFKVFMDAYCKERPEFSLDESLIAFYSLKRKIEDIWEFTAQILYDNPEPNTRRQAYEHLSKECYSAAKMGAEYLRLWDGGSEL